DGRHDGDGGDHPVLRPESPRPPPLPPDGLGPALLRSPPVPFLAAPALLRAALLEPGAAHEVVVQRRHGGREILVIERHGGVLRNERNRGHRPARRTPSSPRPLVSPIPPREPRPA